MLRVKKNISERLLQMALLLSLINCDRLWPTLTFGVIWPSAPSSAEVEVGSYLDHWGRGHGFGPLTQIHPKSVSRYLDQHWLLNELVSLGRYGDRYPSNIEAYLLNMEDGNEKGQDDKPQEAVGGDQVVKTEPIENDCEDDDLAKVFDTYIGDDVLMLAPEDAELVESLWKIDLDYSAPTTASGESFGDGSYDDVGAGSFLQLPGDEPPSHNHTHSDSSSLSNRRWFLPPTDLNCSDSGFSSLSWNRPDRSRNPDGSFLEVDRFLVDLRTGESHSKRASEYDTETPDRGLRRVTNDDGLVDVKYEFLSGHDNAVSSDLVDEFQILSKRGSY